MSCLSVFVWDGLVRGGSRIRQWGAKILSVAHKSVADPGFEVMGGPLF